MKKTKKGSKWMLPGVIIIIVIVTLGLFYFSSNSKTGNSNIQETCLSIINDTINDIIKDYPVEMSIKILENHSFENSSQAIRYLNFRRVNDTEWKITSRVTIYKELENISADKNLSIVMLDLESDFSSQTGSELERKFSLEPILCINDTPTPQALEALENLKDVKTTKFNIFYNGYNL